MSNGIFNNVPQVIFTHNVSRTFTDAIAATTTANTFSVFEQTSMASTEIIPSASTDISPIACFGFVILILATVGGNTLVLLALYLDKRLHSPSFYLIANMAIADLLLGLSVLPFSSTQELLNERWIFGQGFCSAWLALDVLCCTASIMALMAVSVDRYIGVTRPLNYSSIMTIRRTIYLIIVVWAVSILTSVVPLFGLTDRDKKSDDASLDLGRIETCKVNKNTFYTIFSSLISFYIPVLILLILYSRVYQEAKTQGKKLENEKRRLYEIDYQIASEHVRRKQTQSNGHSNERPTNELRSPVLTPRDRRAHSNPVDNLITNGTPALLKNVSIPNEDFNPDRNYTSANGGQFRNDYSDLRNPNPNDDTLDSGSSLAYQLNQTRRSLGQRISSTLKRHSQANIGNFQPSGGLLCPNEELLIIKRKLHNLRREKKAFRTLGLILSALLICWLPFFVTLPVMSILKHHGMINDENTENTWFKIAFWLGYCNSALNPFVYAFSNRAIRRAFRQILFRRFCCCNLRCWLCRQLCPNKSQEYQNQQSNQYQRARSNSFTTQTSQVAPQRTSSLSAEVTRTLPIAGSVFDSLIEAPRLAGSGTGPVVSFADFLNETGTDEVSPKDEKPSTLAGV